MLDTQYKTDLAKDNVLVLSLLLVLCLSFVAYILYKTNKSWDEPGYVGIVSYK